MSCMTFDCDAGLVPGCRLALSAHNLFTKTSDSGQWAQALIDAG